MVSSLKHQSKLKEYIWPVILWPERVGGIWPASRLVAKLNFRIFLIISFEDKSTCVSGISLASIVVAIAIKRNVVSFWGNFN